MRNHIGTLCIVAVALGGVACARSAEPSRTVATSKTTTTRTTGQTSEPLSAKPKGEKWEEPTETAPYVVPGTGGVSLTGRELLPYEQKYDPSGWSGSSFPKPGIGGGPKDLSIDGADKSTADAIDDNPYGSDEPSTAPAAASTKSKSKELETDSAKDLEMDKRK